MRPQRWTNMTLTVVDTVHYTKNAYVLAEVGALLHTTVGQASLKLTDV